MPVELFDKTTFEASLPKLKGTDKPAWRCIGLDKGEYTYVIPLGKNHAAALYVRSSVDQMGWCRATGEDSIRAFVVGAVPSCDVCYARDGSQVRCEDRGNDFYCPNCSAIRSGSELHFTSLSGKVNRWTTRMPGWQDRLNVILRFLAVMAVKLGPCPRRAVHGLTRLNKVKKAGPNKGRWFISCCQNNCFFEWQDKDDDDDQKKDGLPECPGCNQKTLKELTVKKEGPNQGKKFIKCEDPDCAYFQWVGE